MDNLQLLGCPDMDRVFPYPAAMGTRKAKDEAEPNLPKGAGVLAANLERLMKAHPELDSNPTLGKKAGLSPSAVSRLRNGHNATLDTLERLAAAFKVELYQLLIPNLDATNPQTAHRVSEQEQALYDRIKEAAKALAKQS